MGSALSPQSTVPKASGCGANRSRETHCDPETLDQGIRRYVECLRAAGVETFESCEGGPDHAYAEPTVRFHGQRGEGFRALSVAIDLGLQPVDLRRVWPIIDGEPTGPWWELVFSHHGKSS